MLDLLDLLLLRRGIPADDRSLNFRRVDGNPQSKVIYFLPWHTPFAFARATGMLPLDFLAAYEMPPAIVSSEPGRSVEALLALAEDAQACLAANDVTPGDSVLVGLSVGSYVATYLANRLRARLCFVAGADRADLMLWQSPAARIVKKRARLKGHRWANFAHSMRKYHPAENLAGIARDSLFIMGRRDPFIPRRRAEGLLRALCKSAPRARVVTLEGGHLHTLVASGRHQLGIEGVMAAPRRVRLPSWAWHAPVVGVEQRPVLQPYE
jgi:pimeloyl-ACP methyl ester carboxylesterase